MTSYKPPFTTFFRYALFGAVCCSLPALLWPEAAPAHSQPAGGEGDRPAAVLDGQAIGWPEVAPLLAEAAGAIVIEEVILSRALEQAGRDQSIVVGQQEVGFERELLLTSLSRAAQVPVSEGERLIRDVRISRGLGERRFAGLLERNAMLRAIVRKAAGPAGVVVPQEDIDQAFQLRHGERIRARLILVRTQQEVSEVSKQLAAGQSFSDVAAKLSADPSRLRGGLLDPISPADPSYPVAFRRAIEDTAPAAVSAPVMVTWDNLPGFAIVRVEERLPPSGTDRASVSKELEDEIRAVRERALMDRLARSLIEGEAAKLSVLDDALEWSWRSRRGSDER